VKFVVDIVATGRGFFPSPSVFPSQNDSANVADLDSDTCCSYQKDERATVGNFSKKQCYFGNWGALDRSVLLHILSPFRIPYSLFGCLQ